MNARLEGTGSEVVRWHVAGAVEPWQRTCRDRAEFFEREPVVVMVVADGAGGIGGGAEAASHVVRQVAEAVRVERDLLDPGLWCALLKEADASLLSDRDAGETTAVVAACSPTQIAGASVGDCGCWMLAPERRVGLTLRQQRKPLLGSGGAIPVPFARSFSAGTVLVASDGLLKYASMESIASVALHHPVDDAVGRLVDLVRLKSGALPDDVAIVLCRKHESEGRRDP